MIEWMNEWMSPGLSLPEESGYHVLGKNERDSFMVQVWVSPVCQTLYKVLVRYHWMKQRSLPSWILHSQQGQKGNKIVRITIKWIMQCIGKCNDSCTPWLLWVSDRVASIVIRILLGCYGLVQDRVMMVTVLQERRTKLAKGLKLRRQVVSLNSVAAVGCIEKRIFEQRCEVDS